MDGKAWVKNAQAEKDFHTEMAERELKERMSLATIRISTLQDAVELGMATDSEVYSLKTWRQYRVLLSRVDTSTAPDVDWPEQP